MTEKPKWYNPFTSKERPPKEKVVAAIVLVVIIGVTCVYLQAYSQQQAQLEEIRKGIERDCNKCLVDESPALVQVCTWETKEECRGWMEERCGICYPKPIQTPPKINLKGG